MQVMSAHASTAILERIVEPDRDDLRPEVAKFFLKFKFGSKELAQMKRLSAKAREGTLSQSESSLLDQYILMSDFIALLQSKARLSLKRNGSK